HDAAHEAQVRRQELAPVVHDEDALHVELQAAVNAVALMEIERSLRGNIEERAGLEASLDVDADVLERIVPVVADVLVELAVLLLRDLVLAACSDRLHRFERFAAEAGRLRD